MSLATQLQSTALRLIQKFGAAIVVTQKVWTYNPATSAATSTDTVVPTKGIVAGYDLHAIGGGGVQAGDLKITVAGSEFATAPVPGDTVELSGETYTVVTCSPTYLIDRSVIYDLQVRK